MSDRDILRQASDNSDEWSDEWSDETWAAWGRDAAFIAHARTDVPALLAEVQRLRAALSSATDVIAARDDEIGDWSAKNAALRAELRYAQLKRDDNWRQAERLRAELADRPTQTKETNR